ncbi:MAG: hypothetical protein OXR07_05925 [Nitrospira sp.]|nr:hypothetical protein [Nitrospira sp.]MDD9859618.1 hypothetical protein [Nitrospira sp.]
MAVLRFAERPGPMMASDYIFVDIGVKHVEEEAQRADYKLFGELLTGEKVCIATAKPQP